MIPDRLSILINSWKRVKNIHKILEIESDYDEIEEIIVFNNNRSEKLKFDHPKVKIINCENDFGIRCRWALGTLSRSNFICFQDDDLLLPAESAAQIRAVLSQDSTRLYGLYGRNFPNDEYNIEDQFGEVEMVLTRVAFTNRKVLPFVIDFENRFFEKFGFRPGQPDYCNGEDILLSFACFGHYHRKNFALNFPVVELPEYHGISWGPNHLAMRTNVLLKCRELLNLTA